jgi:hypothetical protein
MIPDTAALGRIADRSSEITAILTMSVGRPTCFSITGMAAHAAALRGIADGPSEIPAILTVGVRHSFRPGSSGGHSQRKRGYGDGGYDA